MGIPLYIKDPLLFIMTFMSILGWGFALEKIITAQFNLTKTERFAVHLAGGMFFTGFIFFFLGISGLIEPGVGVLLNLIGLIFFFFGWVLKIKKQSPENSIGADAKAKNQAPNTGALQKFFFRFVILLISGLMFFHLLACFLADIGGDSMNYHLSMPKLFLMKGKIFSPFYHIHGNMYLGASMTYMLGLCLDKWGVVCKFIQWLQLLGTVILVYCIISRLLSAGKISANSKNEKQTHGDEFFRKFASLAGAAFFLFNFSASHYRAPIHVRSDITAMLYITSAIFLILIIINENRKISHASILIEEGKKWLYAGIFISAAAGVKYTAVIFGFIPFYLSLAALKIRFRKRTDSLIKEFLLFIFVAGIVFLLPWILRSWISTGSPMYPSFQSMIKPEYKEMALPVLESQNSEKADLAKALYGVGNFGHYISGKIMPAFTEGDFLLPAVFFLAAFFIFSSEASLFFAGAFCFFAFIFFIFAPLMQLPRLFSIISPVTAALYVILLTKLLKKIRFKESVLFFAVLLFFINYIYHQKNYSELPNIQWMGKPDFFAETRIKYVKEFCYMHEDIFPVYDYIDKKTKTDAVIFMVEQPLPFYCPRPFISRDYWHPKFFLLHKMYDKNKGIDLFAKKMKEMGATHILVNTDEIPFEEFPVFLEKYCKLLFKNNKCSLYLLEYTVFQK